MTPVYVRTSSFRGPLDPFYFDDRLRMDVPLLDLDVGHWQGVCLSVRDAINVSTARTTFLCSASGCGPLRGSGCR